jgi:predicted Zn-dependent protease
MIATSHGPLRTEAIPPRTRMKRLELLLLPALVLIAIWLWSAPYRTDRMLSHASLATLRDYVRKHPDSPHALYYLGTRLNQLGLTQQAAESFQHAASLSPDYEEAWLAAASASGASEGDQAAFNILDTYLKAHASSARGHFALALLYQHNHAHRRAYEEASKAAQLNPHDAEAWRIASVEALSWNRLPDAETAANRAVTVAPKDWRCRKTLGDVELAMNHNSAAEAAYRSAVQLAPNAALANLSLGRMLLHVASTPAGIEEARQCLEQASRQDPAIPVTYLLLSQAASRTGRWDEAQAAAEQAERLEPANADVALELARIYRRAGRPDASAREARRYQSLHAYTLKKYVLVSRLESSPEDVGLRLEIARLCASHNEVAEAIYYYTSLLARDSANMPARAELQALQKAHALEARSLVSLPGAPAATVSVTGLLRDARSLYDTGQYAEAKRAYLALLKRTPNSAEAFEGVGLALDAEGSDDAFYFLEHAVRINPRLPEAQFVLGLMFDEAGFSTEAARRLEIATKCRPDRADYWQALGKADSAISFTYAQAEDAYRHAAAAAPRSPVYLLDLADMELENHKLREAEADYRRALALAPEDEETLSRVGAFFAVSHPTPGSRDEGEALLRRAVQQRPEDDVPRFYLAKLMLEHGDVKPAIADLEAIVSRSPEAADVWYTLSRAYARQGDATRACQASDTSEKLHSEFVDTVHLEEMVRANPRDAGLHLKLARLNARRGANAKAINQYQLCLHLDPVNKPAKSEMAALEANLRAEGHVPSMRLFNAMLESFTRGSKSPGAS